MLIAQYEWAASINHAACHSVPHVQAVWKGEARDTTLTYLICLFLDSTKVDQAKGRPEYGWRKAFH